MAVFSDFAGDSSPVFAAHAEEKLTRRHEQLARRELEASAIEDWAFRTPDPEQKRPRRVSEIGTSACGVVATQRRRVRLKPTRLVHLRGDTINCRQPRFSIVTNVDSPAGVTANRRSSASAGRLGVGESQAMTDRRLQPRADVRLSRYQDRRLTDGTAIRRIRCLIQAPVEAELLYMRTLALS